MRNSTTVTAVILALSAGAAAGAKFPLGSLSQSDALNIVRGPEDDATQC